MIMEFHNLPSAIWAPGEMMFRANSIEVFFTSVFLFHLCNNPPGEVALFFLSILEMREQT